MCEKQPHIKARNNRSLGNPVEQIQRKQMFNLVAFNCYAFLTTPTKKYEAVQGNNNKYITIR